MELFTYHHPKGDQILGENHTPEEIAPFPCTFFYWIDPWGVRREMEQGRPINRAVKEIVG